MAAKAKINHQKYPRIDDENDPFHEFLDESSLKPHAHKIVREVLEKIIRDGILYAAGKSGRVAFEIPDAATADDIEKIHRKAGRELFAYFLKYCGDPAATAYACLGRSYRLIAREHFRNRNLQKIRMNSGWRYQYIAKEGAARSKRFLNVSDIGTAEADFNVEIATLGEDKITIYISVKNRVNTMGGQDWPKAIEALEKVAATDKNRHCPYLCVFGIVMDKGKRTIKCNQKSKKPYSINTEVWPSDFFWPFFINYSYEELMTVVLDVLMELKDKDEIESDVPDVLVEAFGDMCRKHHLLDKGGNFHDAHALVKLFVGADK